MRIGTSTLTEGMTLGRMIGASIDAGPSPSTAAVPAGSSTMIWSRVIEKSAATPTGRRVCGSAKATCSGRSQTSSICTAGSSGDVHVASSDGSPTVMPSTWACANFAPSIAVRALSDGHMACAWGASSGHCWAY